MNHYIRVLIIAVFCSATPTQPIYYRPAHTHAPQYYQPKNNIKLSAQSYGHTLLDQQMHAMRAHLAAQQHQELIKQHHEQLLQAERKAQQDAHRAAQTMHYQRIEQRLATIMQQTAQLPSHQPELVWYKDQITTTCSLAHQANQHKAFSFASKLTNLAQELLTCAQAVALGIGDGIVHTASALAHPVDTIKNIALGIVQVARAVTAVVAEAGLLSHELIVDPGAARARCDSYCTNILWLKNTLADIPKEHLIRQATALAVEAVLLQKTIGMITKLCDKGLSKAAELVQKATADQPYMVAEGVPIQIANSTSEYVQKMAFDTGMKGKQKSVTLPKSFAGYTTLDEEIVLLRTKWAQQFPDGFPFHHIFEPEIRTYTNSAGIPIIDISGWHHDYHNMIFNSGFLNGQKVEFITKRIGNHGVYFLEWCMPNGGEKSSTFFPSEWSRDQVMQKINEAFLYMEKQKTKFIQQQNGYSAAIGFTKEGICIKIIKNKDNKLITAYPIM
jgi:hypothetical protein